MDLLSRSWSVSSQAGGWQQCGAQAGKPAADALAHHLLRAAEPGGNLAVLLLFHNPSDDRLAKIQRQVLKQRLQRRRLERSQALDPLQRVVRKNEGWAVETTTRAFLD